MSNGTYLLPQLLDGVLRFFQILAIAIFQMAHRDFDDRVRIFINDPYARRIRQRHLWRDEEMLSTNTNTVEGQPVREYLGIVTGEVIVGANLFRDLFASITDIVGGRSGNGRTSPPARARKTDRRDGSRVPRASAAMR